MTKVANNKINDESIRKTAFGKMMKKHCETKVLEQLDANCEIVSRLNSNIGAWNDYIKELMDSRYDEDGPGGGKTDNLGFSPSAQVVIVIVSTIVSLVVTYILKPYLIKKCCPNGCCPDNRTDNHPILPVRDNFNRM